MEERQSKILHAIAESEEDVSIRSLASSIELTERECEIAVSALINSGYLSDIDGILGPKDILSVSESGKDFIQMLKKSQQPEREYASMQESMGTHEWVRMGDYGSGSGQLIRDKWYPMGAYCKKCRVNSQVFKAKPFICPKK